MYYDADRHVLETVDMWAKYVASTIYTEYPISIIQDTEIKKIDRIERLGEQGNVELPPLYFIGEDIPVVDNWGETEQIASVKLNDKNIRQRKSTMSPIGQLISMDESNISFARLCPTFATFIVNHSKLPSKVSLAYADGYNRWLKDYCDGNSDRLKAVGIVSRHDPSTLVSQLDIIIKNGWTAVVLRPEVICGRDLGHNDNEPFWTECEKQNIAVVFHGGTCLFGSTAGSERFSDRFSLHACSHPMEAQMAFLSLLTSGVLERHPKLKFAFLEAGASWVPSWLWRLDNICYPEFPTLIEDNIKMLPSEYFKRQCWVGIELGEPCQREICNTIGHKKLLFGTDYPHPDHIHVTTEDIEKQLSELTKVERDDVLINNAVDFYERPLE